MAANVETAVWNRRTGESEELLTVLADIAEFAIGDVDGVLPCGCDVEDCQSFMPEIGVGRWECVCDCHALRARLEKALE